jgi:hypothetical protein
MGHSLLTSSHQNNYVPELSIYTTIGQNSLYGATSPLRTQSEMDLWVAIEKAHNKYGTDREMLWTLSWCESRYDENAVGDGGRALGVAQWWASSWKYYNEKYGTNLDRFNTEDQIEMTAKVLLEKNGWRNWYNCFTKTSLADKI